MKPQPPPVAPRFGALLKQLRLEASLTLRSLGKKSGIPHSVIAVIESGTRNPNLKTAERLAEALQVSPREAFLLSAISTTKNQKMLPVARQHNATVLNYLPLCLAHLGIVADEIAECRYGELPYDGGLDGAPFAQHLVASLQRRGKRSRTLPADPATCPSLLVRLKDGRVLRVSLRVAAGS